MAAVNIQERFRDVNARVEGMVANLPVVDTVAQKTGLPKAYVVYGVIGLVVGFFFFGLGAGLFCNLIGFVYPAYMSFKAIESEDKNDDTMWLTYWVVYSFFTIIEGFADVLLFWIPFYYAAKLAFLFWLFLPMTQGARVLYDLVLRDLLKKHERTIDSQINRVSGAASSAGKVIAAEAEQAARAAVAAQINKRE